MLQVARLAPRLLRDSSEIVREFLLGQVDEDGGFRGREGASDLYYTVFGLDSLRAIGAETPALAAAYARRFAGSSDLDLVHLACLARCHAALSAGVLSAAQREWAARRLETFRSLDGGYHNEGGRPRGTVYGCFLALGAYQDLGMEMPEPARALDCVASLRAADGGYANEPRLPQGTAPATAAAVCLLRHLGAPCPQGVAEWLLARAHPRGGFLAAPGAPLPDLLSTATVIHALSGLEAPLDSIREPCLDFIDQLWSSRGSFYAHWAETRLDAEYTFYGLLALGHLSV
ncbi:MAG: hypothetical protein JXA90_04865 [Planctomycetes bacterium]|nr:hypothetical protein [Planctomycetota bacterium]